MRRGLVAALSCLLVVGSPAVCQAVSFADKAGSSCNNFLSFYRTDSLLPSEVQSWIRAAKRAIQSGHEPALRSLMWQGAPEAWFAGTPFQEMSRVIAAEKKLILASAAGLTNDVENSLTGGVNINIVPEQDAWMPPLHWAAMCNQVQTARLLLDRGANPNLGAYYIPGVDEPIITRGFTPLMAAASEGSVDVVKLLLSRGAVVNTHSGPSEPRHTQLGWTAPHSDTTALIESVSDPTVTSLLLQAGARPDEVEGDGQTALFWAARDGNEATAALLLRAGANACHRDVHGQTVLDAAAGSDGRVRRLIASYASECNGH